MRQEERIFRNPREGSMAVMEGVDATGKVRTP